MTTNTSDQQYTTLTGKPLKQQHDHLSNVFLGDGGAALGAPSVGANLLPPGYTDKSLVRVPIKLSDFAGLPDSAEPKEKIKEGLFAKLGNLMSKKDVEDFKVVMMSRGDYLKYWAKGEDGQFLSTVQEPPEGRAEWVRSSWS